MTRNSLCFKAGRVAYDEVRANGFSEQRIGTIAGASGGAKWLVLSQLDRVIAARVLPRLSAPVHLIGSSIGAWRFSCYAQSSPVEAIERFEAAYLEQKYSDNPDANEISARSREILEVLLGDSGASDILNHPVLRTHIMTVRSRRLTASERRPFLAAGLMAAATANIVSRRSLGVFFRRSLFSDPRDTPPFYDAPGFPLDRIRLTEANLADAVLASGAIPLVLNGVRNIDGAPAGIYRDGGIIDYHLDLPLSDGDRLTLFPHFFERLIPGWFDKKLTWRQPDPGNIERTILVCPSAEFIDGLPNRKVPDRSDFVTMSPELRVKVWKSTVAACERLAEELNDVLDKEQLPARLQRL
ncbi:MAG: patatin-like phospholipase family protein [Woeseiaceae bacterium]|nr:patatin-like phospholipase family protein [Woeseiaceae bacterium]